MAAPSYRAPLLWLLIPLIGGYTLGYHLPTIRIEVLVSVAALSLVAAYRLSATSSLPFQKPLWSLSLAIGVSTSALLYFQQSRLFPNIWEELPPREAFIDIKVKRLYASADSELIKGIGRITQTDDHLKTILDYPVYFSVKTEDELIQRGDSFSARGVLSYLPFKESTSLFEEYLKGQSIPLTFTRSYLTAPPTKGNRLEQFVGILRRSAIRTLGIGLKDYPAERSIYLGMMLGIKGELSNDDKELFLRTGTLHLFAISGLHVGIIAVTLASLFTVLRVPRRASVILGLVLLFTYVEVTGASPSAVRAFCMTAFFWAGKSLFRQMPPFQALVASALTVLITSPTQLFSAGFQLSYTVVTGILLWGIPLFQFLREGYYQRIPQKVSNQSTAQKFLNKSWELVIGTFCISFSATLSSAPLSILYFGILAPFAVFLNMILVPMASLVIVSGLFSIISSLLLLPSISTFFNHGPLFLIKLTNWGLELLVSLPNSYLEISWWNPAAGIFTVLLFLGSLLACHALKSRKRWLFCFPFFATAGMIFVNSIIRT